MALLDVRQSTEPLVPATVVTESALVDSWNRGFMGLLPPRRLTVELEERWAHQLGAGYPQRWWVGEVDGTVAGFVGIGPSRDPIDPSPLVRVP